jgi:hypothetical protein
LLKLVYLVWAIGYQKCTGPLALVIDNGALQWKGRLKIKGHRFERTDAGPFHFQASEGPSFVLLLFPSFIGNSGRQPIREGRIPARFYFVTGGEPDLRKAQGHENMLARPSISGRHRPILDLKVAMVARDVARLYMRPSATFRDFALRRCATLSKPLLMIVEL